MHADRLTLLADKLTKVSPDKFNLRNWFIHTVAEDRRNPCGFAGCAVGHACVMPEFNALGLYRLLPDDEPGLLRGEPVYAEPDGQTYHSWSAVRRFFDLTTSQADYLFDDSSYVRYFPEEKVPPETVAARLRAVVSTGFPSP